MPPELLDQIEAAAKAAHHKWDDSWAIDDDAVRFVELASPANILALVAEVRRLEGYEQTHIDNLDLLRAENTRLREALERVSTAGALGSRQGRSPVLPLAVRMKLPVLPLGRRRTS